MTRLNWPPIIEEAATIVTEYDIPVTLRQLFYRLVAAGLIPNRLSAYTRLSRLTAKARREDGFPRLADLGRAIDRPTFFDNPAAGLATLIAQYRLDRTMGQPYRVYLGVEKATLSGLFRSWFADRGLPVVALRGYSSQTLVDDVADEVAAAVEDEDDTRPTVLLYVGDLDPSGLYIPEDFVTRAGCFDIVERLALTWADVDGLAESIDPAKPTDPRYARFAAEAASLGADPVQVEVEALPPEALQARVEAAVARFWDEDACAAVLVEEATGRAVIEGWA